MPSSKQSAKLSVVAVANSVALQQRLQQQLSTLPYVDFHGEVLLDMAFTVEWWQTKQPDIVIIDLTNRELDGNLFIEAITLNPPKPCQVFALHQKLDNQLILNAIRSGAKEFVQYPEDAQALDQAFERAWRQYCLMHQAEADERRLIVVYGNKGGMGTTTVAINLAIEFQVASELSVCLVDADQNFCNTSGWLNATPNHSLSDLAKVKSGSLDDTLINQLMSTHESGLPILFGCHNMEQAISQGGIPLELWEPLLEGLQNKFKVVIVDLPSHQVDPVHQWLVEKADQVLVISQNDVMSLFQTRQYLELVRQHLPIEKFNLVVNRVGLKGAYGVSEEQLLAQFRHPVFARLSNDWNLLLEAISLGKPVRMVNPKAPFCKDLHQLYLLLKPGEKTPQAAEQSKPGKTDVKPAKKPQKPGWLAQLMKRG